MRWEDERYVRVYTRDTTTWKLLCWQAKALIGVIMRKLDRAGILDLGADGLEGLAAVTEMPLDFVRAGMHGTEAASGLLGRGVFVLGEDGRLVMPNFIEAQEAAASPKLRAELYRERVKARDDSLGRVTNRDDPVTNSDDSSREQTARHEPSQVVTGRHSVPCLAVPNISSALADGGSVPDRVSEVYGHWLAGWHRVVGGRNPPKLSDPRRAKIRARLAEGYTVEQIKTAIDAMWASPYHVENKHFDLELVCRNSVKLDAFLAKTESARVPQAPARKVNAMGTHETLSLLDRLAARPAGDDE